MRALVLAALTAACAEQPAREAVEPAAPATTAEIALPEAGVGALRGRGGGLEAEVSTLAADTGGLNTRVDDLGTVVELPADTLFEFDRAELTPTATANLLKAADAIRRAGGTGAIAVTGHTDAKGGDAYNQRLSEARARSVAEWMKAQVGVRQRAFTVIGKGESEPVVPNARHDGDDEAGRARNRRAELLIPNG